MAAPPSPRVFVVGQKVEVCGVTRRRYGRSCAVAHLGFLRVLQAQDFLFNWYVAKVMQVDETAQLAYIHFEGWNKRVTHAHTRVRLFVLRLPALPPTSPYVFPQSFV